MTSLFAFVLVGLAFIAAFEVFMSRLIVTIVFAVLCVVTLFVLVARLGWIATGFARQIVIIAVTTPFGFGEFVLMVVFVAVLVTCLPTEVISGTADFAICGLEIRSGAAVFTFFLAFATTMTAVDATMFAFVVLKFARVTVVAAALLASVVALGAIVTNVRCCE